MNRLLLLVILFYSFSITMWCEGTEQYKLLPYDAWDGEYTNEKGELVKDAPVYKPYPVIFIHGFAGGDANTWKNILPSFHKYYDPYQDYDLPGYENSFKYLTDTDPKQRKPYVEVMDMQDKNGSVDTYNSGDEITLLNEQNTNAYPKSLCSVLGVAWVHA